MNEPLPANPAGVTIEAHVVSKTTFAAAQNAVPIIRQLLLRNATGETFTNLKLSMTAQPAFSRAKEWVIDRLPAGETVEITARQVTLDFGVLDRLNEAEHGQLVFKLMHDDVVLDEQTIAIELLARDEWGGTGEMAHILAAFVSPNHGAVAAILKEASRLLQRSGHKASIEGYQSRDPRRAYMLAASVWSAISGMGLSYAQPPRSFEMQGQKIRDPGTIASTGLATCLDTTLLLASAFEAAGLNPIVVFTQGHAFVGVWLVDKTFPLTIASDVMEVRKAVDAGELVVLETTLLTHRPTVDFKHARAMGKEQLAQDAEKSFHMAVDIARARAAGIRPISSRDPQSQAATSSEDVVAPAALPDPPSLEELPVEYAEALSSTPDDRLNRWQKKLLDLSLRNRLLNFAATRQTLKFICADVASLEDALAAGDKFRVISIKDENPVGNRDPQLYRQQTGKDIQEEFAAAAFAKGQVCAAETGKEMLARLTTLYRKAKNDMDEGGANTLFMAVGFLRWKKEPTDERTYLAPLLLLPIKLSRRSVNSDYFLSHHEDDVVFNQTLLEFLEQDFGLSIPALRGKLPEDHSGLNIKEIFKIVKHAVRDAPGFEVVQELALSTFSFAKYLMWKDLVDRTDSLRNNPLVKHLLDNPTQPFGDDAGDFPAADVMDHQVDAAKLFTPLPADSSQLAAIVAAERGKNFVIIGPPGTGKSQTIANMIAHCLAHGKTVLFVAEKGAALDVVYRRLDAYGLSDACLELHSNKADRKKVIAQLGRAWDRAADADDAQWQRLAQSFNLHRDELNQYVHELHQPGSHGRSVFEGYGILAGKSPKFKLVFPSLTAHDSQSFESLIDLAKRLALTHQSVEACDSLNGIGQTQWSYAWQTDLLEAASQCRDDAAALADSCARLGKLLGLAEVDDIGNARLSAVLGVAKAIATAWEPDLRFAPGQDLAAMEASLGAMEKCAADYRSAKASLGAVYEDAQIMRMPLQEMDRQWRQENAKLWPFSLLGKRRVRKFLESYAAGGDADPASDIPSLIAMQAVLQQMEQSPLKKLPGFNGVHSDVSKLAMLIQCAKTLEAACTKACQSTTFWPRLEQLLPANSASCELAQTTRQFLTLHDQFTRSGKRFTTLAGKTLSARSLGGIISTMNDMQANAGKLNEWVKWSQVKQEAERRGLGPMVEALAAGVIDDPAEDFLVAYFNWWLPLAIDGKPRLRSFVHWEQEDQIKRFREVIDAIQQLAAQQIRRAVSHDLPARDGVPRKSELGILRHQLGLTRPSETIRGLIEAMPQTFTRLTPCVLMSPLSVAQYLPAQQATFDMVIFDEASQITTWDAVGAIARGRQSIIVGDPRQLPPTNFFGRTDDAAEQELEAHERDLPSILDEASAAGLPLHQLNWHYRSRDEGLIAFSNHHYYGQRLVTFPSPATDAAAVRLHRVDGIYARGSGRTNQIEAKAVVQFVIGRLREWVILPPEKRPSIGVITFNAPQQELILDLLDAQRASHPELEWFFAEDRQEPVIVKNLENVQGDERDVMVFSITFGPDQAGNLKMDFGAVNREGGEKRLNVAVTRAKSEFHVFSSILADQIDLRRAKGLGAAHLKNYLDYAQRGAIALAAMDEGSIGPAESPFEAAVAAALQSRGWEVRTQIGVSGFRIDLGVVHPDKAGAYLCGIECDGATYHRSATARDRDQVREGVLRNLGWEILRIWSTDWFMHADASLDRVDKALQELLVTSREKDRQAAAEEEANRAAAAQAIEQADSHQDALDTAEEDDAADQPDEIDEIDPPEQEEAGQPPQTVYASQMTVDESAGESAGESADASVGLATADEDESVDCDASLFFESSYTPRLTAVIDRVVAAHGPISETMLYRHVARLFGWQRAGRRIQERIMACVGENECRREGDNMFIWQPGSHQARLAFRAHLNRPPRDIPKAEIFGLIDQQKQILQSSDRAKELATAMGLGRLSADTRAFLDACIAEYEQAMQA